MTYPPRLQPDKGYYHIIRHLFFPLSGIGR